MGFRKPREADLYRPLLDLLALAGFFAWRQNQGGMTVPKTAVSPGRFVRFCGVDGVSDIIGVGPDGTFLAVEAKMPGKEPTPDQRAFLDRVTRQGGLALVVSSVDQLRAALAAEGYEV